MTNTSSGELSEVPENLRLAFGPRLKDVFKIFVDASALGDRKVEYWKSIDPDIDEDQITKKIKADPTLKVLLSSYKRQMKKVRKDFSEAGGTSDDWNILAVTAHVNPEAIPNDEPQP